METLVENFELCIGPIENYVTPEFPTFENDNSALLKKLPFRWQKCAKALAGLGFIGALALSGCGSGRNAASARDIFPYGIVHNLSYTQGSYRGYSEDNMLIRLHTGGMGSSFYMVHLTEQEVFGIIRARLEAAGLNFDALPPPGVVLADMYEGEYFYYPALFVSRRADSLDFDLFDEERNVAIKHISWIGTGRSFGQTEQQIASMVERILTKHASDINIGTFYSTGRVVSGISSRSSVSYQRIAASRPILVRQLINQADIFIAQLQSEGILERFPDISVIINDAPFDHGEHPILINNQNMVPALELFKALGMDVEIDERTYSHSITGTKNNREIWVSTWGGININRNVNRNRFGDWPEDIPVMLHNDIILAPLQFVADFIGASIDWNEDERVIRIQTRN